MLLEAPTTLAPRYEDWPVIERLNAAEGEREVWAEGRWQVVRSYSCIAASVGPRAEGAEYGYPPQGSGAGLAPTFT